jgi:biuret amidohydrolase
MYALQAEAAGAGVVDNSRQVPRSRASYDRNVDRASVVIVEPRGVGMNETPAVADRSEYKAKMNELLDVDPSKAVILTVDMQNDYLDMSCGTARVLPEEAARVLHHAKELLDFGRSVGIPIIHAYVKRRPEEMGRTASKPYIDMSFRAGLSESERAVAQHRKVHNRVAGAPQAEVPSELVAPGDLHVTAKRVMDAFHGTELDMLLGKVFRPDTVVLTGINTDTCVYATTFGASIRGYQPIVISDCVASKRGLDHHWMALELMARSIAWVMTVDEFKEKVLADSKPGLPRGSSDRTGQPVGAFGAEPA